MAKRIVWTVVQFALLSYLAFMLWFLLFSYRPDDPLGFHPPWGIWVMDMLNLFVHEAGHLFFGLFGRTISVLGGTLMQCLLPLALVVVTLKERVQRAGLPLFWCGESLINASAYIADAPYRNLKLIREGLIHDWHYLLSDHVDAALPLATAVRWIGSATAVAGVVLVLLMVVRPIAGNEDAHARRVPSNTHGLS